MDMKIFKRDIQWLNPQALLLYLKWAKEENKPEHAQALREEYARQKKWGKYRPKPADKVRIEIEVVEEMEHYWKLYMYRSVNGGERYGIPLPSPDYAHYRSQAHMLASHYAHLYDATWREVTK